MLILVLADNLVVLYLGWEGVGLCSYLLIGFWYRDPANGRAARKAFVVTRVGDTALAIGLFLLFTRLGTLDIQTVTARAAQEWPVGSGVAVLVAALLLGGAVGKSAQLPLQTWLPDAMAGPTPVSALIHAATMVTAGVYLIARTHGLFQLAPAVLTAVAVIGALTLLLAGCAALAQNDIKRVLAYSTISQIGYMFLALGVGAWSAAIFHLMTHAFFKALLFLAAGGVIVALDGEHDIFEMGGLRRELPIVFWTFLFGAGALAGLPLVTAGFYSKEAILGQVWSTGGGWLWLAGFVGVALTSLYIFRVVFVAFFGEARSRAARRPGPWMAVPLLVLGGLSLVGGFAGVPDVLGGVHVLADLLHRSLPMSSAHPSKSTEILLLGATSIVSMLAVAVAWLLYGGRSTVLDRSLALGPVRAVRSLFARGWGFDLVYDRIIVRPFVILAEFNRRDIFDRFIMSSAAGAGPVYRALSATQTGRLRSYALGLAAGVVVLLGWVVLS
jgi:NADH-quinone oxidoreductase subunit L